MELFFWLQLEGKRLEPDKNGETLRNNPKKNEEWENALHKELTAPDVEGQSFRMQQQWGRDETCL